MFTDDQVHQLSNKLKSLEAAEQNVAHLADQFNGATAARDKLAADVARLRLEIASGRPSEPTPPAVA